MLMRSGIVVASVVGGVGAQAIPPDPPPGEGGCLVWDDFEDGTPDGIWTYSASAGSAVSASESGGHIGISSSGTSGEDVGVAFGWSTGWAMDMSQDWEFSASWSATPPLPDVGGDVGLSIVVMLEGDPDAVTFEYGVALTVGRYNDGNGDSGDYETFLFWENDEVVEEEEVRTVDSGVVCVWYNHFDDVISMGDSFTDPDPWTKSGFLADHPSGAEAIVGFGAHSGGPVSAFGPSEMYGDNWCVFADSVVVGEAVGACCIGEECVQTIEQSCDGEWQGTQTDCGDCAADSCYGDVDESGDVSNLDIVALIGYWDEDGGSGDIDGSGVVDVHDLLDLLYHWGDCP